jgi:hypothetical protein
VVGSPDDAPLSVQIPLLQQPIESQSIVPAAPVVSPQISPFWQQLVGGSWPGGLVQRQLSPAAGRGCAVLPVCCGS